jgi:hypothetical protein
MPTQNKTELKYYLKLIFSLSFYHQTFLLVGAFLFKWVEYDRFQTRLERRDELMTALTRVYNNSSVLLPMLITGNTRELVRFYLEEPRNSTLLLDFMQESYSELPTKNPWNFYSSYVFSCSVAQTVGFWWWVPESTAGKALVFLWGFPAMALGIVYSMVLSRIVYQVVFHPTMWSRCPCIEQTRLRSLKGFLIVKVVLIFLTMTFAIIGISKFFSNQTEFQHMTLIDKTGNKLYFLWMWASTLGTGGFNTYDMFIYNNIGDAILLQLLFFCMWILIGSAIQVMHTVGGWISKKLHIYSIWNDDEDSRQDVPDETLNLSTHQT